MKRFCVFRFFASGGWMRPIYGDVSKYTDCPLGSDNARVEVTNELRYLGWLKLSDVIYIGGKFYLFREMVTTDEDYSPGCITFEELPFTHSSVLMILDTYLMGV